MDISPHALTDPALTFTTPLNTSTNLVKCSNPIVIEECHQADSLLVHDMEDQPDTSRPTNDVRSQSSQPEHILFESARSPAVSVESSPNPKSETMCDVSNIYSKIH